MNVNNKIRNEKLHEFREGLYEKKHVTCEGVNLIFKQLYLLRNFRCGASCFVCMMCRPTRKTDLVMPDEARAVARDLGVYYYETSVLTHFGVNEVFENAIRAALMARRQQRFWMTNLKKVQRPLLQVLTMRENVYFASVRQIFVCCIGTFPSASATSHRSDGLVERI